MPPRPQRTRPNAPPPTNANDVLARIAGIDFVQEDGIKMLLFGRSGTGKTTFWGTFPGPILVMLASGGKRPGELRSIDTPECREKVHQVTLTHSDEVFVLADHAKQAGYATVVLDHATGLQDLTLKQILGLDDIPLEKNWGLATKQQYGQSTTMCKEVFKKLLNLPQNVVVVAQQRAFGGDDDEDASDAIQPFVGAGLTPRVADFLHSSFDYSVQTFIRRRLVEKVETVAGKRETKLVPGQGTEFCLRVSEHESVMTKFRVPRGTPRPEVLVDPTYEDVRRLIKGE